jgi:hypothetical protein
MNQSDLQVAGNQNYAQTTVAGGSIPYDHHDQFKKQLEMQFAEQNRRLNSMSSKLNKVAELFELDVLSEEEALKACKVIIGQHAKSKPENDVKIVK